MWVLTHTQLTPHSVLANKIRIGQGVGGMMAVVVSLVLSYILAKMKNA
jgi:hypothetical protein